MYFHSYEIYVKKSWETINKVFKKPIQIKLPRTNGFLRTKLDGNSGRCWVLSNIATNEELYIEIWRYHSRHEKCKILYLRLKISFWMPQTESSLPISGSAIVSQRMPCSALSVARPPMQLPKSSKEGPISVRKSMSGSVWEFYLYLLCALSWSICKFVFNFWIVRFIGHFMSSSVIITKLCATRENVAS